MRGITPVYVPPASGETARSACTIGTSAGSQHTSSHSPGPSTRSASWSSIGAGTPRTTRTTHTRIRYGAVIGQPSASGAGQLVTHLDLDAQLLGQLAVQRLQRRLPRFDLAARQLPTARELWRFGPPCGEQRARPAQVVDDGRADDQGPRVRAGLVIRHGPKGDTSARRRARLDAVPSTPRPRPLADDEIDRQLTDLPGVRRDTATSLVLRVKAGSFADAVRLVTLVAQDAEQMDHHPEIHLRLRVVTFTLTTNWEHAITQFDVELAHRILEAVRTVGAEVLPAP